MTIQEMRISINVLKKIAIVGRFAGFSARFSDWFTVRQKQWSTDHRKKGVENSGKPSFCFFPQKLPSYIDCMLSSTTYTASVPRGSCKMCLGIKSREGAVYLVPYLYQCMSVHLSTGVLLAVCRFQQNWGCFFPPVGYVRHRYSRKT